MRLGKKVEISITKQSRMKYRNGEESAEKNVSELKLKLESLEGFRFLFSGKGMKDVAELWRKGEVSIADLRRLADNRKFFCQYSLMWKIVSHFQTQLDSDRLKILLVIEEVHRFSPKFTEEALKEIIVFLERAVGELRKKGVGLAFIS